MNGIANPHDGAALDHRVRFNAAFVTNERAGFNIRKRADKNASPKLSLGFHARERMN